MIKISDEARAYVDKYHQNLHSESKLDIALAYVAGSAEKANQTEVNRWRSLAEQRLMRVEELERNHTESTVDAWGAYHQADGLATSTISLSKTFCENRLLRYYYDFDKNYNAFARAEAYYAARDIGLIRATKDNWKIVRIEIRKKQDSEE